jgi:hypothetical protein
MTFPNSWWFAVPYVAFCIMLCVFMGRSAWAMRKERKELVAKRIARQAIEHGESL